MVEGILAISMVITAVIGGIIIILYLRKNLNIERMALIERGKNLSELWHPDRTSSTALHIGLLMIGGGVGLLIGDLLDHVANMREVGYFASLFIFGGMGLLGAYVIDEKKRERKEVARRKEL